MRSSEQRPRASLTWPQCCKLRPMRRRHGHAARLFGIVASHATLPEQMPAGIRLVSYRGLSAIIADETPGRRGPPPPDTAFHRSAVAALFAHGSIVPVPPGVVFPRTETLGNWLELHYAALSDALSYVEGRGEARLHVRWSDQCPPARRDGGQRGGASSSLSAIALGIFHELGDRVVAWTLASRPMPVSAMPVGAPLLGRVAGDLFPSETGEHAAVSAVRDGARDVREVSASFLVERSRWREFAEAVGAEAQPASGIEIVLSGPWPPYDFVRFEFGG
jgi:hypothetical protein